MLRITTQDDPRVVTLRVEGRLIGPWVAELEKCWRSVLASASGAMLRVDLSGVTFIDAAGKAVMDTLQTITFSEKDGKTTVKVNVKVVKSTPEAAPYIAGMEEGWKQTLDKLGEVVTSSGR